MRGKAVLADALIGPHSAFTTWIFEVASSLASVFSERPVRHIDRFDTIDFLADPKPIILTHYPSAQLVDAIEAGDIRVTFVSEDPLDVAEYLISLLDIPPIEAIRAQTASTVANHAIGHADNVLYLDRATERSVERIASLLAAQLQLATDGEAFRAELVRLAAPLTPDTTIENLLAVRDDLYAPPRRRQPVGQFDELSIAAVQVIEPLVAMARGDTLRPVIWPTPIFKFGDRPDLPPPKMADIAGPPRTLYYGPYLYLPPGRYRVEAILSFSEEIKDVPFAIEIHAESWLVTARIDQRRGGNYRGYCMVDHRNPCATIEIRLRNERGVEHGQLALIELLFFRQPHFSSDEDDLV